MGSGKVYLAILVAALGYFVDVYDIWLFAVLRVKSLSDMGFNEAQVKALGEALINYQMGGFILGAVMFGVIADRKGRLAVLFSSIILYSLANIANGFAHSFEVYAICRFVAGVGLAGELGAGIALVSELVKTTHRGWATTFVATVGVLGSVVAPIVGTRTDWRTAYFIGGGMGLVLLLMRIGVFESGIFEQVKSRDDVKRGDFLALFRSWDRLKRYLATTFCGAPVWFFAGLMMTFAPEIQKGLGIPNPLPAPQVVMIGALGLSFGDILFGVLSQLLKSRKKAFYIAVAWMTLAISSIFLFARDTTTFYWLMFVAGLGAGYWAVFVTTAGEVFGTNLRGTVATTAPSFVRGLVIPMTLSRRVIEPSFGFIGSTALIGGLVLVVALVSIWVLPETFHRDMDFVEE
ncbi:MAG: MFS transporter [Armatimonadetes bacterium]|nr:MFS transporter [Armatimonadota bacterium]